MHTGTPKQNQQIANTLQRNNQAIEGRLRAATLDSNSRPNVNTLSLGRPRTNTIGSNANVSPIKPETPTGTIDFRKEALGQITAKSPVKEKPVSPESPLSMDVIKENVLKSLNNQPKTKMPVPTPKEEVKFNIPDQSYKSAKSLPKPEEDIPPVPSKDKSKSKVSLASNKSGKEKELVVFKDESYKPAPKVIAKPTSPREDDPNLEPCPYCDRRFNKDRVERHMKSCQQRPEVVENKAVFDGSEVRKKAIEEQSTEK